MTVEQSICAINYKLQQLQRRIRCGEVLYTGEAPSGAASCTYKLAVDYTTGILYYKDELGEWQPVPGGGGGGGGSSQNGQIEAVVGTSASVRNTTGTLGDLTGVSDGSAEITFPDFAGSTLLVFIGSTLVPGIDPTNGSLFYTLSGNIVSFSNGTLATGDILNITIL